MKFRTPRAFVNKILAQIEIGRSKRLSFIKLQKTNINLKPTLLLFKKIGLILHFTEEYNQYILWLRCDFNGRSYSSVTFQRQARNVTQSYVDIKHTKKSNLTNLNAAIVSTTSGCLNENQLLQAKIGGVYLYGVRYYHPAVSLLENKVCAYLERLLYERISTSWFESKWLASTYGISLINMYSLITQQSNMGNFKTIKIYFLIFKQWLSLVISDLQKLQIRIVRLRGIGYKFEKIKHSWVNINIDTNHLLVGTLANMLIIRFSRKFRLIKIKTTKKATLNQFIEKNVQLKLPHKYATKREGFHLLYKKALSFRFRLRRYVRHLPAKKRKRKRRTNRPKQIKQLVLLDFSINSIKKWK